MVTRESAQQLQEQQVAVVEQAKQVQAGLEKLVRGLVELAKTDEAAQKLVTKFGIKVNDPAVPTSTPSALTTTPGSRPAPEGADPAAFGRAPRNRKMPGPARARSFRAPAPAPG